MQALLVSEDFNLYWGVSMTAAALLGLGLISWREKRLRRHRRRHSPPQRR